MDKLNLPIATIFRIKNYIPIVFFFLFITITSCSSDDPVSPPVDESIELNAKAGLNQQVEINQTVTLDGSGSTGPTGFTYSWTYQGDIPESEINFQNKTSAKPTFVPPANGVYSFTLTINYKDSSNSDQTTVLAGGSVEIGGTLAQNLELKNIQPNSSLPDYTVTSDLIVPDGITLSIIEDDVVVEFNSGTGVHVQQGGTFTNVAGGQNYTFNTELTGMNGWKGILIEDGTINLEQTLIVNAGETAFANQSEAAAVILSGTQTNLVSFSDNEFVNSYSYDILVTDKFPEVFRSVESNKLSYIIPIKAPITFMGFWFSENPNINPETYDYIHLIPSGANTKDEITNVNGFSFHPEGTKFYIDGDFWAGSTIGVGRRCTIYMKENSGILVDESLRSFGVEGEEITFTGINGQNWKGFASRGPGSKSFKYTTIENAGYGNIEIGGLMAEESAVIYSAYITGVRLEDCTIMNSGGFGYYNELTELVDDPISKTLFKNCQKGGIATNLASVNLSLKRDHSNEFELDEGVPAVLVNEANLAPEGRLYGLGDNNYYLMNTDWEVYGDFIIEAGVHLKFKSGHSFVRGAVAVVTYFHIAGTSENPVIFDSEDGTPGSWGGMLLEGRFKIEHFIIRNGGEFLLPNATETANIISNYPFGDGAQQIFENSTVSNSAGWGIVVESGTYNFEFDDPTKNNTFSNNSSGDILVKP